MLPKKELEQKKYFNKIFKNIHTDTLKDELECGLEEAKYTDIRNQAIINELSSRNASK